MELHGNARRRHFREWEVVERVKLKIDGVYQMPDSLHHRKYILYFHGMYIKKSQRLTADRSLPGDTAECCFARSVFSITLHLAESTLLIPAEESIQTATAPYLVLFQFWSVGILCRVGRTTRRHTKVRNLGADHLEQLHAHSFDQHLHRQNYVTSELPAPL